MLPKWVTGLYGNNRQVSHIFDSYFDIEQPVSEENIVFAGDGISAALTFTWTREKGCKECNTDTEGGNLKFISLTETLAGQDLSQKKHYRCKTYCKTINIKCSIYYE